MTIAIEPMICQYDCKIKQRAAALMAVVGHFRIFVQLLAGAVTLSLIHI